MSSKALLEKGPLAVSFYLVVLNVEETLVTLNDEGSKQNIQVQEKCWQNLDVSSVPTMVFNHLSALNRAQPVDVYK